MVVSSSRASSKELKLRSTSQNALFLRQASRNLTVFFLTCDYTILQKGQKGNSVLSAQGYIVCDMKRTIPWTDPVDVISSDESSSSDSDIELNDGLDGQRLSNYVTIDQPIKETTSEGVLIRRAEMYQDYMRHIPIPVQRGSAIPFSSWAGLGKSMKQLYQQPLHYLTNILLNKWDQQRIGSEDEHTPLDIMIHPCKAEATIWLVEEVHRRTSSHHHVAKIWQSDPMHHAFVDSIFPKL